MEMKRPSHLAIKVMSAAAVRILLDNFVSLLAQIKYAKLQLQFQLEVILNWYHACCRVVDLYVCDLYVLCTSVW